MNVKNGLELKSLLDNIKEKDKLDLSSDEDLSVAVMNLVSIEEHLFFTGAKLDKPGYYDLLKDVREMRKELLKKLIRKGEGEVWCISKRLLAASYRLMEVGAKQMGMGKKDEATGFFEKAFNLYSLFWGINMGAVSVDDAKKIGDEDLSARKRHKSSIFDKLGDMVQKVIDCCIE